MDAAALELMNSVEISQSCKTTQLEQMYERALRQSEQIYGEERARVLKVQLLLLEDANQTLQEQLLEAEGQLDTLENGHDILQEQLINTEADLHRAQSDVRSRLRDIEHYRAQLNAFSAMSSDSTKLLTEKLALTREVANLRPEIEHLRSQATSHQIILAEKLSLQRELTSLQVELETEKRAVARTKAKDTKSNEEDEKLAGQVEDLKKELGKEKREAQKNEREAKRQAADWESQKTILDSKLDAFRSKLRTTKDQLKEAQKELEEAQAAKSIRQAEPTEARPNPANPRKRPVARFDPDMTIGTPGDSGNAAKKSRVSALPGDKSTFSITPFLNRTVSVASDSPAEAEEEALVEEKTTTKGKKQTKPPPSDTEPASPAPTKTKASKKTTTAASAKAAESGVLKEVTMPKANAIIQKPGKKTGKAPLAKVAEEENEENDEACENPSSLPNFQKHQPLKKKQKMLGQRKSLFDVDDTEATKATATGIGLMGAPLGFGLRGGGGVGRISLAGKGKTLSEFSPLKKDKRPSQVQAGA